MNISVTCFCRRSSCEITTKLRPQLINAILVVSSTAHAILRHFFTRVFSGRAHNRTLRAVGTGCSALEDPSECCIAVEKATVRKRALRAKKMIMLHCEHHTVFGMHEPKRCYHHHLFLRLHHHHRHHHHHHHHHAPNVNMMDKIVHYLHMPVCGIYGTAYIREQCSAGAQDYIANLMSS